MTADTEADHHDENLRESHHDQSTCPLLFRLRSHRGDGERLYSVSLEHPASLAIRVGMARAIAGFRNHLIGDFTMDAKSSTKTATLTVGNKNFDLPIHSGSVGPDVVDIGKLY